MDIPCAKEEEEEEAVETPVVPNLYSVRDPLKNINLLSINLGRGDQDKITNLMD